MRRLGEFPFWRGEEPLLAALASTYAETSRRAQDLLLAVSEGKEGQTDGQA